MLAHQMSKWVLIQGWKNMSYSTRANRTRHE